MSRPGFPKTIREFRRQFSTDQECFAYLAQSRWPEGFLCPHCGDRNAWHKARRFVYECRRCHRHTSPTAGTVMHRSHVPIQEWFWAAYLVATHTPGISALQLQRQLGLTNYETAWYMLQRLRKGMVNNTRSKLSGIVEADETITGGPAKGKKGRGITQTGNNSLVVGAVEVLSYTDKKNLPRERAGRLRLAVIEHADQRTIKDFLCRNVEAGSTVRSDGWRGYSTTALSGYEHDKRVVGDPLRAHQVAPHIHRVFSNLKTWIDGTHHGVEPKYLQSYLDEYVFRFNRRRTPMAVFQTLLGLSVARKPLTLRNLRSRESTG